MVFLCGFYMDRKFFKFILTVICAYALVFRNLDNALYGLVALYISTIVMDMVIYGRNDSGVALIISERHQEIAAAIDAQLDRGATLLPATGAYTNAPRTVILCAVKESQVGRLQSLVTQVDPDAFMILQKAHQVLGEGFARYSDNSL